MTIEYHKLKKSGGFLHWYDNGIPKSISKEYNEWLSKYEELSKHTCIWCGEKGEIDYNESWLEPLCDKCKKDIKEGRI